MTPYSPLRHLNRTRTPIPLVCVLVLAVLALVVIGPAANSRAEAGDDDPTAAGAVVVITGRKPAHGEEETCAPDTTSGAKLDHACLNARLAGMRSQTDPLPAHPSTEDIIGHGEPNKVGTFSYSGTKQQLGSSFGHSVIPQRPPPPPPYHPPLSAPVKAATAH